MEGVGPLDVTFLEMFAPVFDRDIQPSIGGDSPLLDGVFLGMTQCDELVIPLELREGEPGHPSRRVSCRFHAPTPVRGRGHPARPGRGPVEASDPDVDRVDLPTPEHGHDPVADLLETEPDLYPIGELGGHGDGAVVAEEIGGVEEEDVQRVALDPLAAIDQSAQIPQPAGDLTPAACSMALQALVW